MAGRKSKVKREKAIRKAMGGYKAPEHKKPHGNSHGKSHAPRYSTFYSSDDMVVTGTFSYSGKGFGFCIPDPEFREQLAAMGVDDIFIPPRSAMGAMTGDRITVETTFRQERGVTKSEGEVTSVEYICDSIVGTLHVQRGYAYFTPDAKRYGVNVYIPMKDVENSGAKDGYKVEIVPSGEQFFTRTRSITVRGPHDMPYFDTEGRISTVFGDSLTRDANYAAVLHSSGIRTEFPESVLLHADQASKQPITPDGRHDLRDKTIFTIDGAGAKDLDDAISLCRTGSGWILGVHIADVSHYVTQGSATHEEAVLRGTSVYFTDKVVPMLPESLSNDACSLNAGTDKYALSAEITLDENGKRLGTRVFKSIIRSSVRGVYDEVNGIFEKGADSEFAEKYAPVMDMLRDMHELYEILSKNSLNRGVLELEDTEAVILLDENGHPVDVVKRERGDGEKLIEQFMLQANMGVAEVLKSRNLPCLYRTHEKPDKDKMKSFAIFAHNLKLNTHGILQADGDMSEIGEYELAMKLMQILEESEERGISSMVSQMLLRSMMKAKYQSVCQPHFGLGAETYCHFTSPIRRYPDLFVHSVITAALTKTGLTELNAQSDVTPDCVQNFGNIAAARGESSTECEIRAQSAEREIEGLYMALYMADKVGETFRVTVSSVIRSGMFVQCDNLVEGFVPAAFFPNAKINEDFMTLTCGDRVYTLGTQLDVTLTDVDVSTGKITFEPYREDGVKSERFVWED